MITRTEEWKEIILDDKLNKRYAVSNLGRIKSFTDSIEKGKILKPRIIDNYKFFGYKVWTKGKPKDKQIFIRKLVALNFLPPPKPDQTFVILLDRNRGNNRVDNLKWVTKAEMIQHSKTSPSFIKARLLKKQRGIGRKLTSTKVQYIKLKLADPHRKTRLKVIAKQFGVTTMTLQRIKTGENWGYVKIPKPDKK